MTGDQRRRDRPAELVEVFARFAAFLRAGLALVLPRFELFLRVATRFFALAMSVSCEVCRRQAKSWISISRNSRHRIVHILRAATGGEMI